MISRKSYFHQIQWFLSLNKKYERYGKFYSVALQTTLQSTAAVAYVSRYHKTLECTAPNEKTAIKLTLSAEARVMNSSNYHSEALIRDSGNKWTKERLCRGE